MARQAVIRELVSAFRAAKTSENRLIRLFPANFTRFRPSARYSYTNIQILSLKF